MQLGSTVAALRPEDVAGKALRVHPDQHVLPVTDVAAHQRDLLGPVDQVAVAERLERAEVGGKPRLGDSLHLTLVVAPVADQVSDRHQSQVVLVGELPQLGPALHRAVVVDQLGDRPGRGQPGQPRQIHRRLGVPRADQDAAVAVPQGEDVAGLHDLERLGRRVDQDADRVGPVGRRDPGRDTVARVDRDGVRRPHALAVVRRHERDAQPVESLPLHRNTDDAAGVADRERQQLGGGLARGEDQVAFVLPVLVVHHRDSLAGTDVVDGPFDRVQSHVRGRHDAITHPPSQSPGLPTAPRARSGAR